MFSQWVNVLFYVSTAPSGATVAQGLPAMEHDPEHQLHLRVIVDGKEKPVNVRPTVLVIDVIREALGPKREGEADQYDLVRRDGQILDPSAQIGATAVVDREVLSLNKRDGGGGGDR